MSVEGIDKKQKQDLIWECNTKKLFDKVITALPQFHRSIAQILVKSSAEDEANLRGSQIVEEKDLIIAFFKEVPPAFKDMMKRLFRQNNIDYTKYLNE